MLLRGLYQMRAWKFGARGQELRKAAGQPAKDGTMYGHTRDDTPEGPPEDTPGDRSEEPPTDTPENASEEMPEDTPDELDKIKIPEMRPAVAGASVLSASEQLGLILLHAGDGISSPVSCWHSLFVDVF